LVSAKFNIEHFVQNDILINENIIKDSMKLHM
jgi:hypothetical protein